MAMKNGACDDVAKSKEVASPVIEGKESTTRKLSARSNDLAQVSIPLMQVSLHKSIHIHVYTSVAARV